MVPKATLNITFPLAFPQLNARLRFLIATQWSFQDKPNQQNGTDLDWHNLWARTEKRLLKDHEETKKYLLTQLEGSKQPNNVQRTRACDSWQGRRGRGKFSWGLVCAKVFRHNANFKKRAQLWPTGLQKVGAQHATRSNTGTTASCISTLSLRAGAAVPPAQHCWM